MLASVGMYVFGQKFILHTDAIFKCLQLSWWLFIWHVTIKVCFRYVLHDRNHVYQCITLRLFFSDSKASTTKRNPEALLLPSAIGFLFACFGLFCCFVFLWHSFCRKQRTVDWGRRMDTAIGLRPCNRSMVGDGSDLHGNRLSGHLPSFESAIFDQPPPSYEEAIKGNIHMSASSHSSSKDIVSWACSLFIIETHIYFISSGKNLKSVIQRESSKLRCSDTMGRRVSTRVPFDLSFKTEGIIFLWEHFTYSHDEKDTTRPVCALFL